MVWRQRHAKVAHSVGAREQSSQNAGVRSIRNRAWRECLRKANPLLCQLIDRASLDPLISIAADVVASQRVNGNKKNVPARRLLRPAITPDDRCRGQEPAEDERNNFHPVEPITMRITGITCVFCV